MQWKDQMSEFFKIGGLKLCKKKEEDPNCSFFKIDEPKF
jgi:hypothetical protein